MQPTLRQTYPGVHPALWAADIDPDPGRWHRRLICALNAEYEADVIRAEQAQRDAAQQDA